MMKTQAGFTLIEMMAVVLVGAILLAVSYPSFQAWAYNSQFKQVARGLVSAMREARSEAVSSNLEHRFEIDLASQQYQLARGDRSWKSTTGSWAQNVLNGGWMPLPERVVVSGGLDSDGDGDLSDETCDLDATDGTLYMVFEPNGSYNTDSTVSTVQFLCIEDPWGDGRFRVSVPSVTSGRAVVEQL